MAPALKILADPVADATTKEEAQQLIKSQRALMEAAAKRAGVDLTEVSRVPAAPAVGAEVDGYVFNGGDPNDKKNWTPKAAAKSASGGGMPRVKAPSDYRPASDGSGRMVDVTTGRTLTPEQFAVLEKIERGEPTNPRERALLNN
jgi:hypothetical protein